MVTAKESIPLHGMGSARSFPTLICEAEVVVMRGSKAPIGLVTPLPGDPGRVSPPVLGRLDSHFKGCTYLSLRRIFFLLKTGACTL